ncbi:hypothetical protein HN51_046800 [Arachis hypogaea]
MLAERMTKNLTTPSIFSRKYGLLSKEEAEEDAKQIEEIAFTTTTQHFEKEPDEPSLTQEAAELLEPLRAPSSYTKICFSNRSFGLEAAQVAESILLSIKDQLKEVDWSDFVGGRPEAEALEVMTIFSCALEGCVLRYLNLSNNATGEKGVRAFQSLLKPQNNLE